MGKSPQLKKIGTPQKGVTHKTNDNVPKICGEGGKSDVDICVSDQSPMTRSRTSLALIQQIDPSLKRDNNQEDHASKRPLDEPEPGGALLKRKKVVRTARQSGIVNTPDGGSRHCATELTKKRHDRVVLSIRSVARTFPTFRSWSNDTLRARELDEIDAGSFGRGFVDPDLCLIADSRQPNKVGLKADDDGVGRDEVKSVQTYVQEFASKTLLLATTGAEILQLVERAPQVLLEDDNFLKMRDAAQRLLDVYSEVPKGHDAHHGPSQQHCTESKNSDGIDGNDKAAIDEIVRAAKRRDKERARFKRMQEEGPSYSLGLSSDDDDVANDTRHRVNVADAILGRDMGKHTVVMSPVVDAQKAGDSVLRDKLTIVEEPVLPTGKCETNVKVIRVLR
ncbi:SIT4 phosphatase-associated family protein [Striga asiatica]|uniref:SIT4 phosphatase-associated family protein n=1 Tax=Striga asiatica TaxID=4170 RepID=A0A5A7PRT8_STRAF|nr:SIT4 phosphatase-associated family protein [Striga asiatica]